MKTNCGLDINESNGSGEELKNIILITVELQLLGALVSAYFWWVWTLWIADLAPWLFKEIKKVYALTRNIAKQKELLQKIAYNEQKIAENERQMELCQCRCGKRLRDRKNKSNDS